MIKEFKKLPLTWDQLEGAEELKIKFEKFNTVYKEIMKTDKDVFKFPNNCLIRRMDRPNCRPHFFKCDIPANLIFEFYRVAEDMNEFINSKIKFIRTVPKYEFNKDKEENDYRLNSMGFASDYLYDSVIELTQNDIWIGTFIVNYNSSKSYHPIFTIETCYPTLDNRKYTGKLENQEFLNNTVVKAFYEKWKLFHLNTLTLEEFKELRSDLEIVKKDPFKINKEETKTFVIPVEWRVFGEVEIEAENLEGALMIFCETEHDIPLPSDYEYIDDSFKISAETSPFEDIKKCADELRLYNSF